MSILKVLWEIFPTFNVANCGITVGFVKFRKILPVKFRKILPALILRYAVISKGR